MEKTPPEGFHEVFWCIIFQNTFEKTSKKSSKVRSRSENTYPNADLKNMHIQKRFNGFKIGKMSGRLAIFTFIKYTNIYKYIQNLQINL